MKTSMKIILLCLSLSIHSLFGCDDPNDPACQSTNNVPVGPSTSINYTNGEQWLELHSVTFTNGSTVFNLTSHNMVESNLYVVQYQTNLVTDIHPHSWLFFTPRTNTLTFDVTLPVIYPEMWLRLMVIP